MQIPKWFEKWFGLYGIMDDPYPFWASGSVERIAWRAYKKGRKDGTKLSSEQLANAEHKGNMRGFKRGRKYGMDK